VGVDGGAKIFTRELMGPGQAVGRIKPDHKKREKFAGRREYRTYSSGDAATDGLRTIAEKGKKTDSRVFTNSGAAISREKKSGRRGKGDVPKGGTTRA